MNKVFYLYIIYADCGKATKGFEPVVFRLKSNDKNVIKMWLKDSNNVKAAIVGHARFTGVKPGAVFLKAVYADSEMREELGLPDDGTKLEDVVSCMFKRWLHMKQQNNTFPTV